MTMRFILFALLLLGANCAVAQTAGLPPTPAKVQVVSVEQYRRLLEESQITLEKLEQRAPRDLTPIIKKLETTRRVKRADGQSQTFSGDWWNHLFVPQQRGVPVKVSTLSLATREQTRTLKTAVQAQRKALESWAQSTHSPADAQGIVKQLVGTGQIRVEPTWYEQARADFMKWMKTTWKAFVDWIGGLFPSATPGQMPRVNPDIVKLFFTLTVVALLALVAYLVWRAVGGKLRRGSKNQGAFAFTEDAELLVLPPDELRSRAQAFAKEGNYREALRHLYISLLLELDARGVWRYDARRTNWEHISALHKNAEHSQLVAPLSNITRRFDRVRYGNASCNQQEWTHFESDVDACIGH